MNAFQIKLLAIIFMIIDHIGMFFFPDVIAFRMIGRLAFPLFAWLLANGARHTKNSNAYVLRIFIFACIAQIPYLYANRLVDPEHMSLNVLFTLGLGLSAIMAIQRIKNKQLALLLVVICGAVAHILQTEYGIAGVFSMVCFYLFFNNLRLMILSQIVLKFIPFMFAATYKNGSIEPYGLAALALIALYNQKEGPKTKYLFYVFYPLQYVVVYLVKLLT